MSSLSQEVSVESKRSNPTQGPPPAEAVARCARAVCAHLAADMDALTQLMVLYVCGAALGEPLGEALRRHSRYGVYAGDYAQYAQYSQPSRDYEPYVYAAIPLHAPVPVLRVLSPTPLGRDRKHSPAPSAHHPVYARAPYADEYAPAAHADYDEPQYGSYASHYQAPQLYAAASNTPEEPAILYARPNAAGGYTYHSAPHKQAGKRPPTPSDLPYIIRVHKYRIVKER